VALIISRTTLTTPYCVVHPSSVPPSAGWAVDVAKAQFFLKFDDGKALSTFARHRPLANACDKDFPEVARPADFLRVSRGTVIHTFLFLHFHYFNAPLNTSLH
jgi:hypothetical protein